MKIRLCSLDLSKIPAGRWLFQLLVAVAAALPAIAASDAAVAEPKTHTLFMGVDFSIEQNKQLYRVRDVVGDSFVINVDGKDVRVPMKHGSGRFKIEPSLKLTESGATLVGLKGERAYTLANDPAVALQRALAKAEFQNADAIAAQNQATAGFGSWTALQAASAAAARADPRAAPPAWVDQSLPTPAARLSMQRISSGPGANYQVNGSERGAEGAYDAMDVAFEISADKPLDRPYVVIIVQYHPADGKPGELRNWIYAQALQPVARGPAIVSVDRGGFSPTFTARRVTEPTKVHIVQGGFPRGFELQDFQVHLYNQGEEIATNVSTKRVPLTREEAFQYVMLQYVGNHKGATLPAVPAMGRLPGDLPSRLAHGEFKQTVYVKVSINGKPSDPFRDEHCSQKIDDPYLVAIVNALRFQPALDKGRPVEGVAALNLSQLSL